MLIGLITICSRHQNQVMKKIVLSIISMIWFHSISIAQHADNPIPYFSYGKGLGITTPDSSYSLGIRFRIQNRVAMTTIDDKDLSTKEWEMIVRRLRLRFDGFVFSQKFSYALQLSFSRGDMDWDNTDYPNIVRDAMLFYRPNKHLTIGVGQTKLPGNRQRIVSSGDLQFADRSAVNGIFTVDRDFGIQLYYDNHIGNFHYNLRGAVSNGEGRNIAKSDNGLLYSSRVEIYPLGKFTNGGDYFEADLAREKKPKLAIAGCFAYVDHTNRTGATLGKTITEQRNFRNYGGDMLLKYNGWALSSEVYRRDVANPIVILAKDLKRSTIFNGWGVNTELSYVFLNSMLIGGRYTRTIPEGDTRLVEKETQLGTVVIGKFIKGHRLKVQTDITYFDIIPNPASNHWQIRLQVEMGI
jgi:phosphate-selective porin OprO/OprP